MLNLLDARGAIEWREGLISLVIGQCKDYDGFCDLAGVSDMTASEVTSDKARGDALVRIGAYQLLRAPTMPTHEAILGDDDFLVSDWETRTRLEVVAAMIAESWILAQDGSAMRPVYDADAGDQPAMKIVGTWLGIA